MTVVVVGKMLIVVNNIGYWSSKWTLLYQLFKYDSLSGIRSTTEGQQQRFGFQPGSWKCLNYTKSEKKSAVVPVSSGVSGRKLTSCLCSGYREGLYPALSNINYRNGYHANGLFFERCIRYAGLHAILPHVACYSLKNSWRINWITAILVNC